MNEAFNECSDIAMQRCCREGGDKVESNMSFAVIHGNRAARAKIIPYLVMAMAFVTSDVALARDVSAQNRGGQSIRSTPSIKVARTRAAPRIIVPVYPGIDRSTLGLEYNQQLRLRINPIPPYILIR